MASVGAGPREHPRRALFLRSQSPFTASVVILAAVMLAFGVQPPHPGWFWTGLAVVAAATAAALVVPWERLPLGAQGILAAADLAATVVLALATAGAVSATAVLAAFPAAWLAVVLGGWGAAAGIVGAYAAALVPLLVASQRPSAEEWASALVVPVVVSVLVVGSVLLVREVQRSTERARAALEERNVAAAERDRLGAVLRSFADEIDMGLLFLDADGGEPMTNQVLVEMGALAGWDASSGTGRHVYEADQVTRVAPERQTLARLERGEVITDYLHWIGPRGGQRALLANGGPVRRPDGASAGAMLVVQDITELVRAERAREDGLATLAHELRTPLTSIVGYADLLLADGLSPAAGARVEVISRNAEHLLALTTAYLNGLHRPVELVRQRLGVREIVEATVDVMLTTPGFGERELVIDVDKDLTIDADRDGVTAILTNLLGNAAKFSRACDRVRVAAGEDEAGVWVTVHNTGSQVDADELERIFDRFYRGRAATRAAIGGTGIGLSLSRQIAAAHGGSLTAERSDDGACFRLCLPRV